MKKLLFTFLFFYASFNGYCQGLTPALLYACGPHSGVGLTLTYSSSGNIYYGTGEIHVTVTESNGGWQNPVIISLWASPNGSAVGFSDSIGYYYQPTSDSFTYTIPIYDTTPGTVSNNNKYYAVEVYIPNLNCGYPTENPIGVLDYNTSTGIINITPEKTLIKIERLNFIGQNFPESTPCQPCIVEKTYSDGSKEIRKLFIE